MKYALNTAFKSFFVIPALTVLVGFSTVQAQTQTQAQMFGPAGYGTQYQYGQYYPGYYGGGYGNEWWCAYVGYQYCYPYPCYNPYYGYNNNCGPSAQGNLSITSVQGPTSLQVNQSGTWTIRTNAQSNTYVSVNVRWGDAMQYGYAQQGTNTQVQMQNTFTHVYTQAGTYTITFTATDTVGGSSSATATVQVTGSGGGCGYYGCGQGSVTANPRSGSAPLNVTFHAQGAGSGTYYISYGDGTDAVMQPHCYYYGNCDSYVSSHTYTRAGTYAATVSKSAYCALGTACPQYLQQVGSVLVTVQGGTPRCEYNSWGQWVCYPNDVW